MVFVALFFASVGMMIDPAATAQNWRALTVLVVPTLAVNTVVNALVLRALGRRWSTAWYAGALLAQIGEFSFVLAAVGLSSGLISEQGHQLAIGTIALTLLLSAPWTALIGRLAGVVSVARP